MAFNDENPCRFKMLDEAINKLNYSVEIINKFKLIKETLAKDVPFTKCEIEDFKKFIYIKLLIDGRDTNFLVKLLKDENKVMCKISTFSFFYPMCNDWSSCTIEQFNQGLTFTTNEI